MKISYNWLNNRFFSGGLDKPEHIVRLLTFGAFEVESLEKHGDDFVLDVKVLPNRAHDCLSHIGIAREVSILSGAKFLYKPEQPEISVGLKTGDHFSLAIAPKTKCTRAAKRLLTDVHVTESPAWLKNYLLAVGQKPINNVVDAANFVMLETGQPVHTFDADKIGKKLEVRNARAGETVACLDGKTYTLDDSMLVIADEMQALDIAGIKGGAHSGIDASTKRVLISACNFDAITIRQTSKKLGLRTDASQRFENGITPELVPGAIELLAALIQQTDGGAVQVAEDVLDVYPRPEHPCIVGVSLAHIKDTLGISLSEKEVGDIFTRMNFSWNHVDPRADILSRASTLIDVPYKWGASVRFDAPALFDCSSFTAYLFAQAGIIIPRMTIDQYVFGTPIDLADITPGDLIFFNSKGEGAHYETKEWNKGTPIPEGTDHVALFVGDNTIIHASGTAGKVVSEPLAANPLAQNIVGVRRMIPDNDKRFVVTIPFERLDLQFSPQHLDLQLHVDLIEEIERLIGYDKLPSTPLSPAAAPAPHKTPFYTERIKRALIAAGCSEIHTYALVAEGAGDIELTYPAASDKKYLRRDLSTAFASVLERNAINADLLGLSRVQVFEIGTVFAKDGSEHLSLAIGIRAVKKEKDAVLEAALGELVTRVASSLGVEVSKLAVTHTKKVGNWIAEINLSTLFESLPAPTTYEFPAESSPLISYKKISAYPFIVRDIAVFVPADVTPATLLDKILPNAGDLVVNHYLFDRFEKTLPDGTKKISYGVRLIFQSHDRTLTDDEVNGYMEKVTAVLNATPEWAVR